MHAFDLSARRHGHAVGIGNDAEESKLAAEKRPMVGTRNWPRPAIPVESSRARRLVNLPTQGVQMLFS